VENEGEERQDVEQAGEARCGLPALIVAERSALSEKRFETRLLYGMANVSRKAFQRKITPLKDPPPAAHPPEVRHCKKVEALFVL